MKELKGTYKLFADYLISINAFDSEDNLLEWAEGIMWNETSFPFGNPDLVISQFAEAFSKLERV